MKPFWGLERVEQIASGRQAATKPRLRPGPFVECVYGMQACDSASTCSISLLFYSSVLYAVRSKIPVKVKFSFSAMLSTTPCRDAVE